MNSTSKSTFTIKDWKDETLKELGGEIKLTRTRAVQSYEGAIVGEGVVEYLMYSGADGVTHFTGFERIAASLDGKTGSFTIRHTWQFSPWRAEQVTWTIVAGSGTGELAGIVGKGSYAAKDSVMEVTLTYDLGARN